jgi:ethanolamine utilization cobalamin adenosyltransferase
VSSYIDLALRQWLFRNSSLSGGNEFPICQGTTTTPIQHPLLSGETIELDYMDTICAALTEEVDSLVQNGEKTDELLTELQAINSSASNIEANLSSLNATYAPIAIRSN